MVGKIGLAMLATTTWSTAGLFGLSCIAQPGCHRSGGGGMHAGGAVGGPPGAGAVVNTRCPIMGGKVNPAVSTRTQDGRKVGFCCRGCPPAWDKLTDEQKKAKLQAALPKGAAPPAGERGTGAMGPMPAGDGH